ncbi:hypothetical protein [Salinimonas sediminis]|uniref:Ribose-phosphate pyrophosphokinase n=1 Tax=Salinimonas sediminis TaxID=2303538 RepID=A0A346NKR0_9ALTE|nr:hypothetical protein [Salinimonas sediminis]AXR06117.1 hypothetical protein D0Y50_06900 [Salinimonas sediminis]
MQKWLFAGMLGLLFITACTGQPNAQMHNDETSQSVEKQTMKKGPIPKDSLQQSPATKAPMELTGTIVYKNLEGGFFAFISADGGHYTLRNLAAEYKKDGLKIAVTGHVRTDIMTYTQFGEVFEVTQVKVLDRSGVKPAQDEM